MTEQILPFYLVCDESGSMTGLLEKMNKELLPNLHQAIGTDPVTADKTRFSIIGFADDAHVLLPMSDLSTLTGFPALIPRGTTSYGAAFRLLRQQIAADVVSLKAAGSTVYRPAVFFLSDGHSSDNWDQSHAELIDPSWPYHPNIISFGMGDANADTITAVATVKAFMAHENVDPAAALTEFAKALTKSITASGSTVQAPGAPLTLQIPDQIPGFTALPADAL